MISFEPLFLFHDLTGQIVCIQRPHDNDENNNSDIAAAPPLLAAWLHLTIQSHCGPAEIVLQCWFFGDRIPTVSRSGMAQ